LEYDWRTIQHDLVFESAVEVLQPPRENERRISVANYLLVRHKVRNFSEWKSGYDTHLSQRVEAGLAERHLLRGADDPNEVIIFFEAQDLHRAKEFANSADLRETMQKVGVVDKPDIYFLTS
jgi:erythromycin esterase-like protein